MNDRKRIIVEFGLRRQQVVLTDHRMSIAKLRYLVNNHFDIKLETNSTYTLQMYDYISNNYRSLNDDKQIFDLSNDLEPFHRFRIIKKSVESQKKQLVNSLQSTVGKFISVTQNINEIQNQVDTLDKSCDILNQLMKTHCSKSSSQQYSYLLDPSRMKKTVDTIKPSDNIEYDEENFDSVSCYNTAPITSECTLTSSVIPAHQSQSSILDDHIQTRIIPCKYAVRGSCSLGDKCLYLHDEACIQSAREWERRL
ncbi:hypothetical protein I4U23_028820 [Adineta vaga]|nr:hypothetical protein I4U23_028820 [Adineta vaga]